MNVLPKRSFVLSRLESDKFANLWRYRGFIFGMVRREFQSRYLNSLLGSLWSVLNPLAMILIYTVIFSQVMRAKLPGVADTMAYGLYLCAGILPWAYFTELLLRSQAVFLDNASMIKKTTFPRIAFPVILLGSATINFCITFGLFLLVLAAMGRFPGWALLAFLPLLAIQQGFVLGLGTLLGTVNVFFRDVGQLVVVVLQFWFWFTPIVYSIDLLPESFQRMFALNPMVKVVSAYQGIILRGDLPRWGEFVPHLVGTVGTLCVAYLAFRRLSDEMVDEL